MSMFRNFSRKYFEGFSFRTLFLEFIFIIVAIFLGNLATDWNENRNKQAEAEEALQLMCEELSQNYYNLKYYQKYYTRMLSLIDSLEEIGQFETLFELEEYKSINPPIVYTFAYEMAKSSSNLANIEHHKAMNIYRSYISLEGLNETIKLSQAQLLSGEIEGINDWKMTFNFYREPIDLFFRDYPKLKDRSVCIPSN